MSNKTHWKKLDNPDYLGFYSLEDGNELIVTIESVRNEMVTGTGGKKEELKVARLKGQKPMILNATNCKMIAKVLGSSFLEDWSGKQITLFGTTCKMAGDTVECLRVRPTPPVQIKPRLTDERFSAACEKVTAGTYDKTELLTKFDLSQDQREIAAGL